MNHAVVWRMWCLQALVVRVGLPGVNSVAAIELTIAAQVVTLEVPGKYKLQLPLRYKIYEQQATAKFLTSKQQLVLTLPVVPPTAEQLSQKREQHQQEELEVAHQAEQQCEQQDPQQQLDAAAGQTDPAAAPSLVVEKPPKNADNSTQQVSSAGSAPDDEAGTSGAEQALPAIPTAGAQVQDAAVKTANQLAWEQLHGNLKAAEAGGSVQQEGQSMEAAGQQVQPAGGMQPKPDEQQPCPVPAAAKAASIQPRLSSRRVRASDFI
jgi:dynein assembly factor 2